MNTNSVVNTKKDKA